MKKERKDKNFIKKPVYPGGMEAMRKFIQKEMKYPTEANEKRIHGVVKIRYTVDYRGKVIDTKVIKKLGYGCDEEAERIVKLFKFDVAKNLKGKIQFHKTINIHFQLPKKPVKTTSQVNYQVSSQKKKDEEVSPQKSYNYTIKW